MSDTVDPHYAPLVEQVTAAHAAEQPLSIQGGGSKRQLLGRRCEGQPLLLGDCRGVVSYRPTEMVLTARAGTPVRELIELTAAEGQRLPFEPLQDNGATVGGTVATGLSGPARPWRGGVRDALLGTRLINGRGELLRFGGEVMKNVAGYDVSRLQCGALGTLGVIAEVSLRLLPLSEKALTLRWSATATEALAMMRELARQPLPLSGACWFADTLYLRLEGGGEAVDAARAGLPAAAAVDEHPPWDGIREFTLPLLQGAPLWYLSTAPAAPIGDEAPALIDWAGARRFYCTDDSERMETLAQQGRGAARRLWNGDSDTPTQAEPAAPMRALQERLKASLDPLGVLNPGRLHSWL